MEWRPILGIEVSDTGLARRRGRILGAPPNWQGYAMVYVRIDGKLVKRRLHRLIAEAFLPVTGDIVRHLDGNTFNNRLSNLAWGSSSDNNTDTVTHGHHHHAVKTHCPAGHPYDEENTRHYRGRRYCKACERRRNQERNEHRRRQAGAADS